MNFTLLNIKGWIKEKIGFCSPCTKKVIIVAIVVGVVSAIVF